MAYKFNNGRGGVICDNCKTLYDADLSFREYDESYGKSSMGVDLCWRCHEEKKSLQGEMAETGLRCLTRNQERA